MDSRTKVFRAHRALAWFYGLLGAVAAVLLVLDLKGDARAAVPMLTLFLGSASIAAVHGFTASACRRGKDGGRTASIVIACLMLLGFPVGTFIAIYLLANTWRPWGKPAVSA